MPPLTTQESEHDTVTARIDHWRKRVCVAAILKGAGLLRVIRDRVEPDRWPSTSSLVVLTQLADLHEMAASQDVHPR